MASILFYTSIRTRVKDQESLMVEFVRAGHKVYFLNQQPNAYLPIACANAGVHYETITYGGVRIPHLNTLFHLFNLIRFAYRYKIDVIYSHLEPANFIAVLGQYFFRARVIVVRHHLDLASRMGFDTDLSYRLTYSLARDIIAVSNPAKVYMSQVERVDASKIHHIDLGYDFKVFGQPDESEVNRIKASRQGIILVSAGRFDKYKRFDLSIEVCQELNRRGTECHLFLLGSGPDERELRTKVEMGPFTDKVEFKGYVDNVADYLAAADWLLHPSVSESSCVVIKEAGLVNLAVVVCKGVGDFDDYLVTNINAVIVEHRSFVNETVGAIIQYKNAATAKLQLGRELGRVVRSRFDIKNLLHRYDRFHS